MVKQKNSKKTVRSAQNTQIKESFFKGVIFECALIVFVTVSTLWLADYFDVSAFFVKSLSAFQLSEFITDIVIITLGLLALLTRYSLHLRKKMQDQFVAEEEIKRLAFFDHLTNLPSQELCRDRLEHALAKAVRNNTSVAVLYIGIENFKAANDQLGHDGGDKLIKQIAKRLSGELRSGDTLARISGVEFILVLETVEEKERINTFAEKLLSKLAKCYRISMREFYITSNMGIALYPIDSEHSKELIKQADTAMRFAKEQGRNCLAFFSKQLQAQLDIKREIAEQLRGALKNNEFALHYQPIISTQSNKIIAVEALLRWNNKLVGDLSPSIYVPIAEEIGVISQIGEWVLNHACEQNKIWHQQGYYDLVMTINLSVVQLNITSYASTISSALDKSGLAPQYLELEFTENTLMKDVKQSKEQLRELNALGVSIALDSFGTGYSSIKHLSTFKLNKLKVDGSFITNIPESKTNVMAVKGMISLAKQLGLHITAEGVETVKQQEFLTLNQVDSMQGYYFSHPVDSKELEILLQSPSWQGHDLELSGEKLVS